MHMSRGGKRPALVLIITSHGAYGTAFLYRKTVRGALVVIKEINMIESTAAERQMALNEVQVLSVLNHPNIISLYASQRQIEKGEIVKLSGIYPSQSNLLVLVETKVPLYNGYQSILQSNHRFRVDSDDEDTDDFGPVPEWIK